MRSTVAWVLAAWGGSAVAQVAQGATPCEGLAPLTLAGAKVTSASTIAPGAFAPPPNMAPWLAGDPSLYKNLPAFCRVLAIARPSSDSDIKIEVWLPAAGWNGRFRGIGNGGFAGEIDYRGLATVVGRGYATAATDTGHAGAGIDASWALGHPEKVVDFGHRAIHEMTEAGKAAVAAHYGRRPDRSYFSSCSNGGRQALMEAQRYPGDYDGIIAGAPANNWTRLLTSAVFNAQVTTSDDASYIPTGKVPAIARAVNAACDAKDGLADGILSDPRQCRFDPAILRCQDADSESCLTPPQVTALAKLYEGARGADGRPIFPGFLPGAEEGPGGWSTWITGPGPRQSLLFAFGNGFFTNMVYEKPDWSYKAANLDEALKAAEAKTGRALDAVEPDLRRFKDREGKLILYHGWNDPAISALNSIDYYESVVTKMGKTEAASFLRLYMVPGVQHCGDGPGPSSFGQGGPSAAADPDHSLEHALERWVEGGVAPSSIVARRVAGPSAPGEAAGEVKMSRPLCPYPQSAVYKGAGDPNDAGSFTCAMK